MNATSDNSQFSLQFDTDKKDILEFRQIHVRHSRGKKQITSLIGIISILVFFILTSLDYYIQKNKENFDISVWGTIWGITSIIFFALVWIFRFSLWNLMGKIMYPITSKIMGYKKLLGNYQIDFSNDQISVQTPIGTHTYDWNIVEITILRKGYLVLYVTKSAGYIIPLFKAKLIKGENQDALIRFIQTQTKEFIKLDK